MKLSIISREAVKPSSSTPCHLRNFSLSLIDQLSPPIYGFIVFFYPAIRSNGGTEERARVLRSSLSQTLTRFYPMAGRLKDAAAIDCNDEGAYFVEATISCHLSDFLYRPDLELLNLFLPNTDLRTSELASGCLLLVQLTTFDCGGTAISICLSHKITDVSSLVTFLQSWTTISRSSGQEEPLSPELMGASLLPPGDLPSMPPAIIPHGKFITRRLVFEAPAISDLKAKATRVGVTQTFPSRVEVVLALILKRATAASRRPFVLFQAVNLRTRMVPPLPENSVGNLIWPVPVFIEDSDIDFHELVSRMKEEIREFCKEKVNKFRGEDGFLSITESLKERRERFKDVEFFRCTSWCRFPLYEMDYGWGRPAWVSSASLEFKNTIVLVDTPKGNGIEAWVTLEKQEMDIFECDEELLASAILNPSIVL